MAKAPKAPPPAPVAAKKEVPKAPTVKVEPVKDDEVAGQAEMEAPVGDGAEDGAHGQAPEAAMTDEAVMTDDVYAVLLAANGVNSGRMLTSTELGDKIGERLPSGRRYSATFFEMYVSAYKAETEQREVDELDSEARLRRVEAALGLRSPRENKAAP